MSGYIEDVARHNDLDMLFLRGQDGLEGSVRLLPNGANMQVDHYTNEAWNTKGVPTRDPSKIFDIYNANDLLTAAGLTEQIVAPDGVLRTPLLEDARYIIHAAFILPLMLLPITSSTTSALATEFIGAQARSKVFAANAGTNPVFWGRKVNQLVITDLAVVDIGFSGAGQSSILLNLTGGARPSRLTFTNTTFAQFAYLGEATDFTLSFNPGVNLVSIGRGFAFDMSPFDAVPGSHAFLAWRLINAFALHLNGAYINFTGSHVTISIIGGTSTMDAGDEFLRIDSGSSGDYDIVANAYDGIGDLISPRSTITNTLYAEADLVIDSFSDSIEDPGVDTTVNLAAITLFKRGQSILIADEAAYDGPHVITRVADDQLSFDIAVVHSTSGAGTLKQTLVTSTDHGFILNENIIISDTAAYNGATVINLIHSDNQYHIPVAFVSAEVVGTATSIPKTPAENGVISGHNGHAASSNRIASGLMNGNALTTTFSTADKFIGMNLGAVIDNHHATERFTLLDPVIGIYRYDGNRPVTVRVDALIWVVKTSATQNYRLALDKNAEVPAFTTSITSVTDSSGEARFNYTGDVLSVGQRIVVKGYVTNPNYNGHHYITAVGATYFETHGADFGTDEAGGEFENAYSPVEVKTTIVMTAFTDFVQIVKDDTLRIRIAPDGHTDTCTITDFKISITAIS
jgi:hypothetical protein